MGSQDGESSSDSEDSVSNRDLLKRLQKLEGRLLKYKKRTKKHRSRNFYRSSNRSSSNSSLERRYSRSRSRARSSYNRGSPDRNRDYRSPSGYESRNSESVERRSNAVRQPASGETRVTLQVGSPQRRDNSQSPKSVSNAENLLPHAAPEPASDQVLEIHSETEMDQDWLQLLGDDPKNTEETNFSLHEAVSSRWGHILSKGLPSEVRETLNKTHVIPSNCDSLSPPEINSEVLNILPTFHAKRDKSHLQMQRQLAHGLSALGKGISLLLQEKALPKEQKENLLACLGDSGKILTDLFHHCTYLRRTLLLPQMSKAAKDVAEKTAPGRYLFGMDFSEKVKELKVVEKASKDLKSSTPASSSRAPVPHNAQKQGEGKSYQRRTRATAPQESLNRNRPVRFPRESRPQKGYPSRNRQTYKGRKY